MRKIIGISILLVSVTLMSFAGGYVMNPRGELADGVPEIVALEKEYQFFSMLNHIGFSQGQLEQIVAAAEKAQDSILSVEADVKITLERAVDLVKTGETDKAREKHQAAMETAKGVLEIRQTYMDTLKGIITVEQQERFMEYFAVTMEKGMERMREKVVDNEIVRQLPEQAKDKLQQMGTAVRNFVEKNANERPQMRIQPTPRGLVNPQEYANFFNMLLINDNLELMKDYLESYPF